MPSFVRRGAALLAAMLVSHAALAQTWPNRPVRCVVPFAAGAGINDIMARASAGGIPGTEAPAKAAPVSAPSPQVAFKECARATAAVRVSTPSFS